MIFQHDQCMAFSLKTKENILNQNNTFVVILYFLKKKIYIKKKEKLNLDMNVLNRNIPGKF